LPAPDTPVTQMSTTAMMPVAAPVAPRQLSVDPDVDRRPQCAASLEKAASK